MAPTSVDIIDETYIRAAPAAIREQFDDERALARIWPHLAISLIRDRGPKGLRWRVDGAVRGEMEVWIEPFWDGAIVHHYVRGQASSSAPPTSWPDTGCGGSGWCMPSKTLSKTLRCSLRPMADRTESSIDIAANPGEVLDVIADFRATRSGRRRSRP